MKRAITTGVIGLSDDGHSYDKDGIELQFVYNPDEDEVRIVLDGKEVVKADWTLNLMKFCEECISIFSKKED